MTRYLISFDGGAMSFPEEDPPDLAKAVYEVVRTAHWGYGSVLSDPDHAR